MHQLIVENPQGLQEILDITASGSYFDTNRVLWDTRLMGEIPDTVKAALGKLSRTPGTITKWTTVSIGELIKPSHTAESQCISDALARESALAQLPSNQAMLIAVVKHLAKLDSTAFNAIAAKIQELKL